MRPDHAATTNAALIDVVAALVTIALLVMSALGANGPPRVVLALAFVTFVPGWAVLAVVGPALPGPRLALAATLSLTLCSVIGLGAIWLREWRPGRLLDGIAAASLASILAHLAWD